MSLRILTNPTGETPVPLGMGVPPMSVKAKMRRAVGIKLEDP